MDDESRTKTNKKPSLLVRMTPQQRTFVQEAASKAGTSVNELMVNLIERLADIKATSQEDFEDFLRGQDTAHKTSEIIERLQWASHAFEKKHWAWSIEEYQRLSKDAPRVNGVFRLAQYRLGYCWAEIAAELRLSVYEQAAPSKVMCEQIFDAADWSLCAAIFYNSRHGNRQKDEEPDMARVAGHAVVVYNLACCWALRAQYKTERALSSKEREQIRKELDLERPEVPSRAGKRTKTNGSKDPQIAEYRAQALKQLWALTQRPRFSSLPTDAGFLVRRTPGDLDLAFVREHDAEDLEQWASQFGPRSILSTFVSVSPLTRC